LKNIDALFVLVSCLLYFQAERVYDNDVQCDSNGSDEDHSDDDLEETSANAQPPKTTMQVMQRLLELYFINKY
jgi:hypothetical protein